MRVLDDGLTVGTLQSSGGNHHRALAALLTHDYSLFVCRALCQEATVCIKSCLRILSRNRSVVGWSHLHQGLVHCREGNELVLRRASSLASSFRLRDESSNREGINLFFLHPRHRILGD